VCRTPKAGATFVGVADVGCQTIPESRNVSEQQESPSVRLASAYKRLAASAAALNAASDEFSKPIEELETALQRLNLGLITWQKVVGGEDEYENYWRREIGYTRMDGTWGIVIRSVSGNHNHDEPDVELWSFGDAPRSYRIEAVDKLPELLEELIRNSDKTAKKLRDKTAEARELAAAVKQAAEELKPAKKERR
jgi:hypothetical protein